MSTAVQQYRSSDIGAPVLSGTVGALATLLDKCLVSGYSTLAAASLTQTGNVATLTTAGVHGLRVGDKVTVSGAGQPDYNGTFVIASIPTSSSFTYAIANNPASPATGTVVFGRASLGWSIAYTDTNRRAYQQAPLSNGFYLYIDDNQTAHPHTAVVQAYESMSDINTGVNPFVTSNNTDHGAAAWWMPKSANDNATACNWLLVGDGFGFYLFVDTLSLYYNYGSGGNYNSQMFFSDAIPYKPGDNYCTMLSASRGPDVASNTLTNNDASYFARTAFSGAGLNGASPNNNTVSPRSYTGIGGPVAMGIYADHESGINGQSPIGCNNVLPYPNPIDNGFYIEPVYATGNGQYLRALMPGIYNCLHGSGNFNQNDQFQNLANLPGKTVQIAKMVDSYNFYNYPGCLAIDVTGPWR